MLCLTVDDEIQLCLREERHAKELFELVNANQVYLREWLPWLDMNRSVADTRQYIKGALEQYAANKGFQAAIVYQGKIVGMIGFHGFDWPNRSTSIGYWLAADMQGKGIITRACRHLVNYAFTELAMNRVEIRCATGNHKSRAIPERLGFKIEGTSRQAEWLYDHFVDHVVYAMLAKEWQANT